MKPVSSILRVSTNRRGGIGFLKTISSDFGITSLGSNLFGTKNPIKYEGTNKFDSTKR